MTYPIPAEAGHYWAKLERPERMPEREDWVSTDWEVVQVFENGGYPGDALRVSVPGVSPSQTVGALDWGPRVAVPDFAEALAQAPNRSAGMEVVP